MTSIAASSLGSVENGSVCSQLSLPSSFKTDSNNKNARALETFEEGDENSETQLAVRVAKEVKPMMHLLRILKEMDASPESNGKSNGIGNAVASLISELEEEVTLIEHKLQNKNLLCDVSDTNSHKESADNRQLKSVNSGDDGSTDDDLPPHWISLEDPDSGDIYFANEITGETTWDKPTKPQESPVAENGPEDEVDDKDDGEANEYEVNEGNEDDLPPHWFSIVDPASGDTYYSNEVTGETTWDKPEHLATSPSQNIGKNEEQVKPEAEVFEQNDPQDDLPPGWFSIVDPDSGDTYFSNENTGETTWDRPNGVVSRAVETDPGPADKSDDENEDSDLPHGWYSIVDPDSGDTYYSNEFTGETTWDKPIDDEPLKPKDETIDSQSHYQNHINNSNVSDADDDEGDDEGLPHGWISIIDPASGDTYYSNETTGETTWDRPVAPKNQVSLQSADSDDDLPEGWFSVIDPASGDTYYANEVTGETSWDKPQGSIQPRNNPVPSGRNSFTDDEEDDDLPDGWFSVVDPASGDTYYANEHTGETSWDRPKNSLVTKPVSLGELPASEDALPRGWFAVVDPASGDTYYANEFTGETSWDKPVSPTGNGNSNYDDGSEAGSIEF